MTVFDVATYILRARGEMSAMKLQKLVYYSQCWSLVWDERQLFNSRIEAWANGPVCPALYEKHRGNFRVSEGIIGGEPDALDDDARETVDSVLKYYGDKTAQWLSDLTHSEAPWKDARDGLSAGERSNHPIPVAAMAEYYGSL
ncbi:Panacea domain-containing protein [Pseudorhodobacter sp. W20_MBD10_FR17]|uniref:Panacea domain-containing protein n=1 Tax=Pseudorhodobacter sp. W20_MBD10_FR17 TaxID=3240266 RepID=UPI003F9AA672